METKVKEADDKILIRIAEKLVQAQQELDELVLQFSLGKAEAKDKFEEIKSDFRDRIREFKNLTTNPQVNEVRNELRQHLEELEEVLKRGTAQSVEAFKNQKEQIEDALDRFKKYTEKHLPNALDFEHFEHELEKFKLKLEILRLAFELKKFEVKDSFKEKMHDIKKGIEHTLSVARKTISKGTSGTFRKEAQDVYAHLKKAIKEL